MRSLSLCLVGAAAVVGADAREVDACTCAPEFDEPMHTENADVIFDGWVISTYPAPPCPLPPAPKPKAGCVRIAVVYPGECKAGGGLVGLEDVATGTGVLEQPKLDDDAATFCTVKPGKYRVRAGDGWTGDDDWTTQFGRVVDIVPGNSYVVFQPSRQEKVRIGVTRVLKGEVPREVDAYVPSKCCVGIIRPGEGARFFGGRDEKGNINISGSGTRRDLTPAERSDVLKGTMAASQAARSGSAVTETAGAKKSGGCASTTRSSSWPGCLLVLGSLALSFQHRRGRRRVTTAGRLDS